ncbi:MAG: cupin domain-containing protein [Anaerolineaceae bacterium]|jgi:mannose-6-phosphate isomerase-like protein (cupin superfamily)|nr:cupin domain-containing protein [Anaerolineaceae bacterium]
MPANEEVIIKTDNVRARILSLEPGENTAWHYHSEVVDHMFCLYGELLVRLKETGEEIKLQPGQRCEVQTGLVHQVVNTGAARAQYLLIQGVGRYDFNTVV